MWLIKKVHINKTSKVPQTDKKRPLLDLFFSDPVIGSVWPRGWVEVKLYSSMTAALEGGEWSAARPSRTLTPGKTQYPLYRRLGGRSGRAENLVPTGIQSRTIKPVALLDHYEVILN